MRSPLPVPALPDGLVGVPPLLWRVTLPLHPPISDAFVVPQLPGDHPAGLLRVLAPFLKGQSEESQIGYEGRSLEDGLRGSSLLALSLQATVTQFDTFAHPPANPDSFSPVQAPPHIKACCYSGI